MKNDFIIYGKSGCKIDVINKNYNFILKKTSCNIEYNSRLINQAKKQKYFNNTIIKTPKILNIFNGNLNELSFMEMDYILGENIVNFLSRCSPSELNSFISNLISYLDNIIESSLKSKANYDNIIKKIKSLESLNFQNKNCIINILKNIPNDSILIGECHGDLTFSNIIYTKKYIYFIDFLDTFINSPILDIIKIRQDTKHLWSLFLSSNNSYRMITNLKYIDNIIKKKYNWLIKTEWYKYLSLLNYVRIYPYISDKIEISFIDQCINDYI
jgi:thiamine kinase-like enzyme